MICFFLFFKQKTNVWGEGRYVVKLSNLKDDWLWLLIRLRYMQVGDHASTAEQSSTKRQ